MSFCLSKGIWADSCLRQQGGKEKSLTFVWLMPIIPDKVEKLNFARIACLKPFGEKAERRAGEEVNVCSVVITPYLFPVFPALHRHEDGRDGCRLGLRRREDGRHGELGRSQ